MSGGRFSHMQIESVDAKHSSVRCLSQHENQFYVLSLHKEIAIVLYGILADIRIFHVEFRSYALK